MMLPAALHQRLLIEAKAEQKTVSELVRELLDKVLESKEQKRIKKMYQALDKLEGLGDKGVTDASTTIDEVLYGEKGAWRGES